MSSGYSLIISLIIKKGFFTTSSDRNRKFHIHGGRYIISLILLFVMKCFLWILTPTVFLKVSCNVMFFWWILTPKVFCTHCEAIVVCDSIFLSYLFVKSKHILEKGLYTYRNLCKLVLKTISLSIFQKQTYFWSRDYKYIVIANFQKQTYFGVGVINLSHAAKLLSVREDLYILIISTVQ